MINKTLQNTINKMKTPQMVSKNSIAPSTISEIKTNIALIIDELQPLKKGNPMVFDALQWIYMAEHEVDFQERLAFLYVASMCLENTSPSTAEQNDRMLAVARKWVYKSER